MMFFCPKIAYTQEVAFPGTSSLPEIEKLSGTENKEVESDPLNIRPAIEFPKDKIKQIFANYYKQKMREKFGLAADKLMSGTGEIIPVEPEVKLPDKFDIKGLVWDTDVPQAIINGRVRKVGDNMGEVKIVTIDKTGVGVLYEGKPFRLDSPSTAYFTNDNANVPEGGKNEK